MCGTDNNLIHVGIICQALYKRSHEHKIRLDNPNDKNKLSKITMKEQGIEQFHIELTMKFNVNKKNND